MINSWNPRRGFTLLQNDQKLVYLDSAATTQRPDHVLDEMHRFDVLYNANPHRGTYQLAADATDAVERARLRVADFIGAALPEEIVFTRNATEGVNLLARALEPSIGPGDEIVVSVAEHHSNLLPWMELCRRTGAKLVKLEVEPTGEITDEALDAVLGPKTRLVAFSQVSNVLGFVNDVKRITARCRAAGAMTVVDAAQSIAHMKIDVQDLGCDFLVFSGHKMYGPFGIGVLYCRWTLLHDLPPFMAGGDTVMEVHWGSVEYAYPPARFEAGTQNATGIIGLASACDFIEMIGREEAERNERTLMSYMITQALSIPHVHILGSRSVEEHVGVLSFTVDGVHPHDVASVIDDRHICIRAGRMCAQPLLDHLGVPSVARASIGVYNTITDVQRFVDCLRTVRKAMGYAE